MEDTCDIITLSGKFKSYSELQLYSDKQYIALSKAAEKIKDQAEEIIHLKELLANVAPVIHQEPKVERIIVSNEEAICDAQIRLLHERGMTRELTLEETKKLDLLIKNKRLAKEQNTTIVGESKKLNTQLSNTELMQLASKVEKKPDET